jgi:DNA-binding MarR family transcriptional regulator
MSLARRLKAERPADGLTSLELSVLGHLLRRGPMTPSELAAAERVQPQTLTRALAALAAARLLARAPHPGDRRRVLLVLTAAGSQALRSEMAQRDRWLADAMAHRLTPTEQELLRLAGALMERVADDDAGQPAATPARPS